MIVNDLLRASRASRFLPKDTVICPSAIVGQMIRNRGKVKELVNLESICNPLCGRFSEGEH
jgi:hypothetical protein